MSNPRDDTIHLEPSSRCTLACLECPRTTNAGEYEVGDCDIENTAAACVGFKTVLMCGNHGDPIYHLRFFELIASIRDANPTAELVIITNGAFRSIRWWEKLATLLTKDDAVVFSIDGMPNNNHLYRVNSKWNSIESGIRTLRKHNAQVKMIWKWILFNYNQSQILSGINLANDLGFDGFTVVYSARYGLHDWLIPDKSSDDIEQEINEWAKSFPDVN